MTRVHRRALAAAIGSLVASAASWAAPAPTSATFKVEDITPELARLVARFGVSQSLDLPEGTDLLAEITRRCGKPNASGHYLYLFASANPAIVEAADAQLRLTKPLTVTLPACAYAEERGGAVPVNRAGPEWTRCELLPAGDAQRDTACKGADLLDLQKLQDARFSDYSKRFHVEGIPEELSGITSLSSARLSDKDVKYTLDRVLKNAASQPFERLLRQAATEPAIGRTDSRALRRAINTQSVLLANAEVAAIRALELDDNLIAPVDSEVELSITLASPANEAALAQELALVAPDAHAVFATVVPMSAVETEGAAGCEPDDALNDEDRWPIHREPLDEILLLTQAASALDGRALDAPGRVLVADAGLPELSEADAFLDRRLLPDRTTEDPVARRVWTTSRSVHGQPDGVQFAGGSEKSGHGVGVLALAAGAFASQTSVFERLHIEDRTALPVNIYFVSDGQLQSNDLSLTSSVDEKKWRRLGIDVVNYSLSYTSSGPPDIFNLSEHTGEILYVFPAGNDTNGGEDVADTEAYPARLGGLGVPNVITVAAGTPDGELATFSNYSASAVDIAAPGCRVPTYEWDAQNSRLIPARRSGTSYAAPLVSLTASLLRQHRLGPASAVKRRILANADVRAGLLGRVASGRMLNVPKALSVRFDFIESVDGTLQFGRITNLGQTFWLCNAMLRRDQVLSVWLEDNAQALTARPSTGALGVSFPPACKLQAGELANVSFRRAAVTEGHLAFGPPQSISRSNLKHVGLCDISNCVDLR